MKKVVFVGNDVDLKVEYARQAREHDFIMLSVEEAIAYSDADTVVISDKSVSIMALDAFISNFNTKNFYYLISNSPKASVVDNQVALVKKLNINVIYPRTSVKAIVSKILGLSEEISSFDNVVGFIGTYAQVGVTSMVLMVATQLAAKDLKVCVLGLNQFNSGITWYEKYEGNTFDEMYEELVDNHSGLTTEKLDKYMHHDQERKFKYLAGNKDFTKQNYFGADEVDQLIYTAARSHDVVLLDLGCNPTNYLAIKGLERSGSKLLVANQLQPSVTHWQQVNADVFRLLQITKEEFLMIINRFSYNLPSDQKMLSEAMNVPTIAVITEFGAEGAVCESECKLLIESSIKAVKRDATNQVAEITKALLNRLDVTASETKEKRGWRLVK